MDRMNNKIHLYVKLFLGTGLSIFLIFFTWKLTYAYYCLSLFFPLLMLLVISYGYIELKMEERKCIRKCYFQENTLFSKLLSSHIFVTLFYIIASVTMSISTFMVSLDFSKLLWGYLVLHIILSIFMFRGLYYVFQKIFQENYQKLFAREWSVRIMAVLLISVFVYLSLNTYTPEYLTHSLKETIGKATSTVSSDCRYIEVFLQYGKSIDASFWWVVNESTEQVNNTLVKTGIWLAFLFYNSLAILGINRFIFQIIYMLNNLFDQTKEVSCERK